MLTSPEQAASAHTVSDCAASDLTITLPTVLPVEPVDAVTEELVLSIVFHPDLSRVGERAVAPADFASSGWSVGRLAPLFTADDGAQRPLADAHISRRALSLGGDSERLSLQRISGSSRCCAGDAELEGTEYFSAEQLRTGVPVLLANTVVLLLRIVPVVERYHASTFGDQLLLGNSAAMHRLRRELALAAKTDVDVLLLGETGTGKELAAQLVHTESQRAAKPLVSVNVAAIPVDLAAAALFGAARGAFTGAVNGQQGYFEQANGGCLFLDEIGDLNAEVQPLLLRTLQQREIQRVGGSVCRVDVRVISATDAAIDADDSDFKAALRHRLGACEVHLPALRDHPEDIGELLLHFLNEFSSGLRSPVIAGLDSPGVVAGWAMLVYRCLHYHWPGNVRQLANVARQLAMSDQAVPALPDALGSPHSVAPCVSEAPACRRAMRDVDDAEFDAAMSRAGFEPGRAARELGVSRSSVYRRIEASRRYCLAQEVPLSRLREVLAQCDEDVALAARSLRVSTVSLARRVRVELHC